MVCTRIGARSLAINIFHELREQTPSTKQFFFFVLICAAFFLLTVTLRVTNIIVFSVSNKGKFGGRQEQLFF